MTTPNKQVRAVFDDTTIRVYQAYSHPIADAALAAGRFVAPFSLQRMTWIKPSFLWMMYRCGWTEKDPGQDRVLAIDISREGFEWALRNASLSHAATVDGRKPPVRVQWDPERSIKLARLEYRSIQIGLSGPAVHKYVNEWTRCITDITPEVKRIKALLDEGRTEDARAQLPTETPYPLPSDIEAKLS